MFIRSMSIASLSLRNASITKKKQLKLKQSFDDYNCGPVKVFKKTSLKNQQKNNQYCIKRA